ARVDIRESESQKISRFIDGARANIQDEVFKQSHNTLFSTIQLALKSETQLNKRAHRKLKTSQSSTPLQRSDLSKGKAIVRPYDEAVRPTPSYNQSTTRPQREIANNNTNNPYAILRGNKCYRCGQTGHYSNQFHQSRPIHLITHDDDVKRDEAYFENEEYVDEVGPKKVIYGDEDISLVIRQLMYTPKKEEDIQ
ncbi:Zinc finger, CCHC-type, partial [Parasponia andersonii]